MIRIVAFVALLACGCLRAELVACDDGRLCPAGTACTPTGCTGGTTGCGNGAVDDGSVETCDDGNTVSGDGCSSVCELEGCGNAKPDVGELCDDGNLVAHDGCSASCQREVAQWISLEPSADDERQGAAVAFIPSRGHIVRFGGTDVPRGIRGGTYELDGDGWRRITTTRAPSARTGAASAYDSARERWVLFGGDSGTASLADTWEFDGNDWSLRAVSGPPAGEHAMTYDAAGQRIVLYADAGGVAETWTFDGDAWSRLDGAAPPVRTGTALGFDPTGQRVVLFSGASGGAYLDETWELVGDTWTLLATTGAPPARWYHTLAYEPGRDAIMLQGGEEDTWILRGSTWTQLGGEQARSSVGLALVFDPVRGRMVRYGGATSPSGFVLDDLYTLEATGWQRIGPPRPEDRSRAPMVTDTLRDRLVLYGGFSWSDSNRVDTWIYDADGWRQVITEHTPPDDEEVAMAYDAARDRVVLVVDGQTWEFDDVDWAQVTTAVSTPTIPSFRGPIIYERARGRIVGVAGAETYAYDGTDWTLLGSTGELGGLNDHAAAYDLDRDRVMLFDQYDLWELDGDTWIRRAAMPSPEPRERAVMAYDPIRHRLLLVGGNGRITGKQNDTWEWDGQAWSRVVTRGVFSAREWASLAWLPSAGAFVMFGGNDREITMHDTWMLTWAPLPP